MNDCLTEEQLRDLAGRTVTTEVAAVLLSHVDTCRSCREALAEWRKSLPFLAVVEQTLRDKPAPDPGHRHPKDAVEQIQGYQIQQEIHCGAQGVVYRALDEATRGRVAIKFVGQGPYISQASRRRFEREIDLVGSLHHPNIIRIMESGTTGSGRQYFVMDYIDGMPLQRYVWQKGLSLDMTLTLFLKVCDAVNYAHQRGVIHRDLKPSNILVEGDDFPRVLDFGLARHTLDEGRTHLSMTGQIMGTLPYMSPEQARGDRDAIDIRTDVYALGTILYEVLTGRYPYPVTGSVTEALRNILDTTPSPPSRVWNADSGISARSGDGREGSARRGCPIDDDIDTIVLKALAKEPARRYANVAMLMEDISRYLRGQPIEARREAWVHAFRKRILRYKAAAALAVACALVTAISTVAVWGMYRSLRSEHKRSLSTQAQLAPALMRLGDNALAGDQWEEASGQYRAALAIINDLLAAETHNREFLAHLIACQIRMGNLMKRRGDPRAAAEHYRTAANYARQLSAADPGNVLFKTQLAEAEALLGGLGPRQRTLGSGSPSAGQGRSP